MSFHALDEHQNCTVLHINENFQHREDTELAIKSVVILISNRSLLVVRIPDDDVGFPLTQR